MKYQLKPDQEKFEVVDGPGRGTYVHGVLFKEIPKGLEDRFQEAKSPPPAKEDPSGDDAGIPAKPGKRGGKDK